MAALKTTEEDLKGISMLELCIDCFDCIDDIGRPWLAIKINEHFFINLKQTSCLLFFSFHFYLFQN